MRTLVISISTVLFLLVLQPVEQNAQASGAEIERWQEADAHALNAPRRAERGVDRLADYFLQAAETDEEKARMIYRWMTDRIAYDTDAFFMGSISNTEAMEVLRFRKAVCSGYAVLFQELAEAMDLEVRIITGHSKGYGFDPRKVSTLADNHAWIAARINGNWELIDPTWGAGHIPADSRDFVKQFSGFYFMADPKKIIYTHFPSDPQWQLLDEPVDSDTYLNMPQITTLFYQIGMDLRDNNELFLEANGDISLEFGLPEEVSVTAVLRHLDSGEQERVFMRYVQQELEMLANLGKTGDYSLDIFARQTDEPGDTYHLVVGYLVQNQTISESKRYPEILAYYGMTRANLQSPMYYDLKNTDTYTFSISIPDASEVYLVDGDQWLEMNYVEGFYELKHQPDSTEIMIVAKIRNRDNYGILVSYGVEQLREVEQE